MIQIPPPPPHLLWDIYSWPWYSRAPFRPVSRAEIVCHHSVPVPGPVRLTLHVSTRGKGTTAGMSLLWPHPPRVGLHGSVYTQTWEWMWKGVSSAWFPLPLIPPCLWAIPQAGTGSPSSFTHRATALQPFILPGGSVSEPEKALSSREDPSEGLLIIWEEATQIPAPPPTELQEGLPWELHYHPITVNDGLNPPSALVFLIIISVKSFRIIISTGSKLSDLPAGILLLIN